MTSPTEGRDPVLSGVTLIVGVIVALTFLFGFGNVFTLALRLGVPAWVAPLVAVGPLLLIGWAEVGPAMLQALAAVAASERPAGDAQTTDSGSTSAEPPKIVGADLLDRARHEDHRHRELLQRPVSAENLRKTLG